MSAQDPHIHLLQAGRSLAECEFLLRQFSGEGAVPDLIAQARHHCDQAEQGPHENTETAATLAILRAVASTFALRHVALSDVCCDFDDDDGTLLNGLGKHDSKGVSRPLAEEAVLTAEAALIADPHDALMPLYLGHALTWVGNPEAAIAAYQEALRRAPDDQCARSALSSLHAPPTKRPQSETRHPRHAFALLRSAYWINNNEWEDALFLFTSVADVRTHLAAVLGPGPNIGTRSRYLTGEDLDDEGAELALRIYRPGCPITKYDLSARLHENTEPTSIDWTGVPVDELLEPPLPPGRPLRLHSRVCFHHD
ncbi:tetratricopeptide repeat protein [Nonomuraea sp. LPB2021202275-12-8]|uniref:tetratricopeptide repeat protein n=1 Tax=Nonomuraea sp. LPB2021202275-12-8 TaxID=3120159 RepID=UPI00300D0B84